MIVNLLVVLGAAIFVATLFYRVKLPPILAFLTAGILIGPSALGLVDSRPQVGLMTEIAGVLLMFTIGLEFSFKELMRSRRPLLFLGFGQVSLCILVFTLFFKLTLDFSLSKSIFLSFLVTLSSTAVILKLLQDNRETETPYGRAAISTLLMQDICVIPMIIMIPFLLNQRAIGESFLDSLFPVLMLTALFGIMLWLFSKYLLPFLFDQISRTKSREIFFFAILFIVVGASALMHQVGLSVSLGAFIAGMILAGSPYGRYATAEILPLRDAFLSLFFVAIGMLLDLQFLWDNLHKILLFGFAIVIVKSAIIFSLVWLSGNMGSVARATTALLFQFGEFSFILSEIGLNSGIISEKDRQYFVAMGVISLGTTPLFYALIPQLIADKKIDYILSSKIFERFYQFRNYFLNNITRPIDLSHRHDVKTYKDHVLVVGFGVAGQSLSKVMRQAEIPYCVIDLNAETVRVHSETTPIVFGDASKPDTLLQAGVEDAKLVAVLASGLHMIEPILHNVRNLNPTVPILIRANYMQELGKIKKTNQMRFVVSEFESTMEVIRHTLNTFDISESTSQQVVAEFREAFRSTMET